MRVAIVATPVLLLAAQVAQAQVSFGSTATTPRVKAEMLVNYSHMSDIFRGPLLPWNWSDSLGEPNNDYGALGATVSFQKWEIDATHGLKTIDCSDAGNCDWQNGTQVAARYYFLRKEDGLVIGYRAWVIEPFVSYVHQSDLLRGPPFKDDDEEPTLDFIGVGLTVQRIAWEVDLSHGLKAIDCTGGQGVNTCDPESGTQLTVRWYPRRGKR